MITFVMLHAARVRKHPEKSPVYELDQERRRNLKLNGNEHQPFTTAHKLVLAAFGATMVLLVYGVLKHGWCVTQAVATFARLYFVPVKRNPLPAEMRVQPTW